MKPFAQLTHRGQARRLRRLAADALAEYGMAGAPFHLIQHWENTTFRVESASSRGPGSMSNGFVPGRFLLRLHRPHERTAENLEAESAWLEAIARDTSIRVPAPVRTPTGRAALAFRNADYPDLGGGAEGTRLCSMLRWVPGRILSHKSRTLSHIHRLGGLMAQLHQHARDWPPAQRLTANRWDNAVLMGRRAALGMQPDVWDELPADEHDLYTACEAQLTQTTRALGEGPDVLGLIHADLHFNNVLFAGSETRPIDFNDCGHGYFLLDIACALMGFDPPTGDHPWQDAFLAGYQQQCALPPGTLEHLNLFIASRRVTLMLWCRACARQRESFRQTLPKWRASFLPDIRARLKV